MNISRKYIIIFGTLILLLLIITGAITYYKEKKSQEPTQISENAINVINPTFDQNYPISFEEADSFQKACAVAVTSGIISAEKRPGEVFCIFGKNKKDNEDEYIVLRLLKKAMGSFGEVMRSFYVGQYIGIAVNYRDLLEKNAFSLSEESSFNLCTITRPALIEPFREQLLLEYQINLNRSIVLSEGEIFCSKFSGLPSETLNFLITGFVPEVDLFQAKMYLVLEDETVNDIFSQESFSDIEEILKSYPLLWNVEKPVI